MSDELGEAIYLVTEWYHHESPDEFLAFDSRQKALDYISQYGVDETDLERYGSPGDWHHTARIADDRSVTIREIDVQ